MHHSYEDSTLKKNNFQQFSSFCYLKTKPTRADIFKAEFPYSSQLMRKDQCI